MGHSRWVSTGQSRRTPAKPAALAARIASDALGRREDVEELHVQPVRSQTGELRDALALLELQDELRPDVVDGIELVEAEGERRRLLPRHEQNPSLDVVHAAEV